MRLIWHPLAMDDFKQIIEYCRLNFGKHISRKIRAKIGTASCRERV